MSDTFELATLAVRLLLNLTLFGIPIVLGLIVAFRLTRTASPRARYMTALAGFTVVAILPVVISVRRTANGYLTHLPSNDATSSFSPQTNGYNLAKGPNEARDFVIASPVRPNLTDRLNIAIEQIGQTPLGSALLILWIAVATVLIGRDIVGHVLLMRSRAAWHLAPITLLRKLNWPSEIPLLLHDQWWPCTVGLARPMVVLPASLVSSVSPEAIKQIAKHELSHARWKDPLINAVVRIVRAILWPSVPLWILERVIISEREVAADRAAVENLTPTNESATIISDYAMTLVSIAKGCAHKKVPHLYSIAATHIGPSRLEERVWRLFNFSERLSRVRLTLAALVVIAGVVGIASVPITSQGLDPQERAKYRRINVERRIIGFANRSDAQQSTGAMNSLIAALKNRDWQLSGEVTSALDQIRLSGTIDPLIIVLAEDRDWRVRENVAWALGQLKDRRGVEPLIVALRDDSGAVKHTAAWSLGMIGDNRATDALIENLGDDNSEARHGAAWALGNLHDARAVDPLITLLNDRFADVRHGAAWALGKIGDKRAAGPLRAALQDTDSDVRVQVQVALSELSRQ